MKATKRDKIALAVAIVLFVLVFIYAVKKIPTVEGKLDGQGSSTGQQSDIKTVSDEWPMKPPVIISISNWDPTGNRRWVKVGGCLAIECRTSPGFSSVSFIPENAPMAAMPK